MLMPLSVTIHFTTLLVVLCDATLHDDANDGNTG
jgi:hypothetical protein